MRRVTSARPSPACGLAQPATAPPRPPGARDVTRPSRRHAHGAPALAAGVGGRDRDAQLARAPRARRRRCAGRRPGRPREREHARAADEHGLEPRAARAERDDRVEQRRHGACRRTCPALPSRPLGGGQHDVGEAGDGRPRGRAARGRCTSPGPARRARRPRRRRPRTHPSGPWSRPSLSRPSPRRARSSSHAAARRDEQERDRAVLALDGEVGVEHERDVVALARCRPGRSPRSRASMSVADCGGSRLQLEAGHAPSALM